ncbi:hypothetical protein DOTSEDRAFT_29817 [Dothistroma septosporum NZE10]|uniref:Uncharacterized protein n=1 Tax=Dothistroma septosporum (strain NZE10 / CBS 128990) TaxID=675120 RepID=N1Q137_DOTSN|nr:hypothetical protein DOTSEDRAFT_29817 [Dothistroma septosporum NZE10]
MPDHTHRRKSQPSDQDENNQPPHSTIPLLAQQHSNQQESPNADMLTNRNAYLETRLSYLGYTITNPPPPTPSHPSTSNRPLTAAPLNPHHSLDRTIVNATKQRGIAATFGPGRSRSAPADSAADRKGGAERRREERSMPPPGLVRAEEEGYSSPSVGDGTMGARTPSEVGGGSGNFAEGEEGEGMDAVAEEREGEGARRLGEGRGLEEGAEGETREVEEE